MKRYVADTHALYWYRTNSPKLGPAAGAAFDEAAAGRAMILIPAIVLAELYYLNVKRGRPLDFAVQYRLLATTRQFELVPFDPADVLDFDADAAVPEMHDRLIAGVARRRGAALLTRDGAIVAAGVVATVW